MSLTLEQVAFRRHRLLLAPAGSDRITPEAAAAATTELAHAGLLLTDPGALTPGCLARIPVWGGWVRHERGQRGTFSPLFTGFPNRLPTFDDARTRFTVAAVRLLARAVTPDDALVIHRISDDDVRAAMDFSGIGWWPASSVPQNVETARVDRAIQEMLPSDGLRHLTPVTLVDEAGLTASMREFVSECFASPTSLRADVREDLDAVMDVVGFDHIDYATVRFVETRTLLLRRRWEADPASLATSGVSPDDILRLFAELTGGDVSLAEKVRFPRLSRGQRRAVVAALEASPRLSDVFRRRGLWLAVARGLHLAEFDSPRVADVFGRLRKTRRDGASLPSRVEVLLGKGDVAGASARLAAEAPGLLARMVRRLTFLARAHGSIDALVSALAEGSDRMPPRVLWAVVAQLRDNGATYPRLAITKTGGAMEVPGPPGHLGVPAPVAARVSAVIEAALTSRSQAREAALATGEAEGRRLAGARAWIDPRLGAVLLPDGLRSMSEGMVQVERGSRLPLGAAPVLRMFVHWKERPADGNGWKNRSDLDLSMLALDQEFRPVANVSWTNLADVGLTHSGDLTSAPDGAQEFIDVRLDDARSVSEWWYLVPAVYRFSGPPFDGLAEATVGWMLRDECSADRATFDPATVVNAFPLGGRRSQALPMVVDLLRDEVIVVDLSVGGGLENTVETHAEATGRLIAAAVARAALRPSVSEVVAHGVVARGGIVVADRSDATVTFGLDEACTFDVRTPQSLLAEFL